MNAKAERDLAYPRRTLSAVVAVVAALAVSASMAAEGERERMVRLVDQKLSSPAARQEAIAAGRRRATLCAYCHGKDGNSLKPETPNLADQNPAYLLQQIEKFVDGRRKDFVMQTLAKEFTMDDKVNLAVYYASQEVEPERVDPEQAARGERLYQSYCQVCHGPDGDGREGFAHLAGQRTAYVEKTLKRFRANAREAGESGKTAVRSDPRMEQVVRGLDNAEITALAAYVARLGAE